MNILIFAEAPEHTQLTEPIENHHRMLFRQVSLTATSDYDQLISLLKEDRFDLVFVAADGARGMEGVIASKNVDSDRPVIWFSDDKNFGPQSYRLGCRYFGTKPVTLDKLKAAFERC